MIDKLKQINFPISEYFHEKVAVAINLYNRIQDFEMYAEHINRCEELKDVPIFIFLDGGIKSKQDKLIEKCKLITHKYKYVIKRTKNFGCERSFINIFDTILKDLEFDHMFFIEDDLIVGKNYFKYLYDTFNKIKQKDPSIAIFQGYNFCTMTPEEKIKHLDETILAEIEKNIGLWGFIMSRDGWSDLRTCLEEYINICNTLPTNETSHTAMITSHRKAIVSSFDSLIEKYGVQNDPVVIEKFYKKQNSPCTISIDGAMSLALIATKKTRYKPVVNRVINVGDTGAHFTKEIYNSLGLNNMSLDEVWIDAK